MIFRTVHNKDNPYFQLDRTSVNDDRLSYKAIGIHAYLMSKPDGWEANEADISSRHTDGRAAVRSGIQELIEYGYMVRVQLRKDKKVVAWRLDTYEAPQLNPHFKPGQPARIVTVDLDTQDLECENLNVGIQTVADLECENLQVEKLDVGNRIHSNYIDTVNNESKKVVEQPPTSLPSFSTSSSTGDPLLDAAKNKASRGGHSFVSWQAEMNLKLEPAKRVPLANAIGKACGLTALMSTKDTVLYEVHDAACWFYEHGFTNTEKIEALHKVYLSDDWRREKHPRPKLETFMKFASQQLDALPQPATPVVNWANYGGGVPDYMRDNL